MKLASFSTENLPRVRVGLVQGDEIVDIDLAARALQVRPFEQMLDLIAHYDDEGKATLDAIMQKAGQRRFSEVRTFSEIGAVHKLNEVQLAAPIPRPAKNVMCLGLNYAEHAKESAQARGREATQLEAPLFFTKAPTTVNGPYSPLVIDPSVSTQIDWEAELAVIIGRGGKNIREADSLDHVFGYTVLNDVSARDLQALHKQFFKGKSIDGYCPMGPWIVTADEIPDPQNLKLCLRVNGATKQDDTTGNMIFSVRTIISVLSQGMTLEPGDIIATGTPSGVGFARKPPEFLKPGDVMETEIEGIGIMKNPVIGV
ncbi:MAG TPA: fumarylacetoacetate hydrolase family protein [Ktedonobacteraceae bacterium]|jgi:2-keto-4-pentenoate hydratase/2-oxohepta-3-ene-1,7-dioic acid hydratase in catechol pathway|nr:fumarylacetoacetate hydrolase family protein [Ktedonobacteraceae bacterium]